jgi:HD-GYP domain-containing protein (c-di-GMP phosphodiesterase class II)
MSDQEKVKKLLNDLVEKDKDCFEHSLRVQAVVEKILTQFTSLTAEQKSAISLAGLLHDIGPLSYRICW